MTDYTASAVEQGLIVPIAAVNKIKMKHHLPYGWRNRQKRANKKKIKAHLCIMNLSSTVAICAGVSVWGETCTA